METVITDEHSIPTIRGTINSSSDGSSMIMTLWRFGRVATTEGDAAPAVRGRVLELDASVVADIDCCDSCFFGFTLTGEGVSVPFDASSSVLFGSFVDFV